MLGHGARIAHTGRKLVGGGGGGGGGDGGGRGGSGGGGVVYYRRFIDVLIALSACGALFSLLQLRRRS